MSDRPQAVRTGARPEGAAGAGGVPATGSAPATGQTPVPSGASPAGATPSGAGPALTKPVTGAVPAQQAPPQGTQQVTQQVQRPADATMPPPTGAGQVVPPAVAAAAAARAPQQAAPVQSAPVQAPPQGAPQQAGQQQAGQQQAGQPAVAQPAARAAKGRGNRGPRRARLQLRHIDTWSALKISLVLSIALFFVWMVAVGLLYGVLSGLGVFDTLNDLFGQLGTSSGGEGGGDVITPGIVFGGAAVIGAINIVLLTALATVAAFVYNLCADLVGGLEVTLAERD
ncbi:Transmembrane protein of unknown function [Geodermatophilus obscurus]|uniref:DUF3566 domain-containing protein n=1 Tax=Geodermatophilus obscurus TaxID=1861 RepID=A0A1I5G4C7_9ACTN|nr:Transmembrane protein of unknown function [Geodermatophilus obscurus]